MRSMTRKTGSWMLVAMLCGCSAQSEGSHAEGPAPKSASADSRPCIVNYSTEGSAWTGKKFATFQEFPNASQANAFDQVATGLASKGFQVNSANKEIGLISASQGVMMGHGATVPINAIVKKRAAGGVRVDVTLNTTGGQVTSANAVQKLFCEVLATVE